MKLCTQCDGYKPDRLFYPIGPNRRMSECAECNKRRKAEGYVPRQRMAPARNGRGQFARAAA